MGVATDLRLRDPEQHCAADREQERGEAADQRGCQCRDDEQRERARGQTGDRRQEDRRSRVQRTADAPVHQFDHGGRPAGCRGGAPVLRDRRGRETEPGTRVDHSQHGCEDGEKSDKDDAVLADGQRAGQVDRFGREDRLHKLLRGTPDEDHDALDDQQDAECGDELDKRGRLAQRDHHQQVRRGSQRRSHRDAQG